MQGYLSTNPSSIRSYKSGVRCFMEDSFKFDIVLQMLKDVEVENAKRA
jgi:hypothetical protein